MAERSDITPQLCRQLLCYEAATGKLYWRDRPSSMYSDSRCHGGVRTAAWAASAWNARHAGKEAFTALNEDGYRVGTILGVMVRAHRVAWAVYHGAWPPEQIDHVNGDRGDNRLLNLRAVPNCLNHRNEGRPKNNTSGVTGVHWCKQTRRWRATIKVNYRNRCLGRFDTLEEAAEAREKAKAALGFDKDHGNRPAFAT